MKESIPLLLSIAAIILLVGILGIASIVLLSKRSRYRPVKPHSPVEEHDKRSMLGKKPENAFTKNTPNKIIDIPYILIQSQ